MRGRGAEPAPTSAPHHDAPAEGGAGGSGGGSGATLRVKEEEAEETMAQQRDRLAMALAHGPVRVDSHIKVEDSTSGEDTDREEEDGLAGEGGDGDEGEQRPAGEGGLLLLAGAAQIPDDEGGAPRRSTPADRAARAKRGRGDAAAGDVVPDAPAPKRQSGGAQVGESGRHGVTELTGAMISQDTPWLKWRAQLFLPGPTKLHLGPFATADDAARASDAEVRRRGWAHVRPLNFPQPEEVAAYAQTEERCDERGLPLSLASEPHVGAHGAGAAQGASGQRPPKLSCRKAGKGGFFGVTKDRSERHKVKPWRAQVYPPRAQTNYVVGYFATKEQAARAHDAEIRRRGWIHIKRLNFPDPVGDALSPPAAAAEAPGSEGRGAG